VTGGAAGLWLWPERGRLSGKEVAGREQREKGPSWGNQARSSLAESILEWGPGTLEEA